MRACWGDVRPDDYGTLDVGGQHQVPAVSLQKLRNAGKFANWRTASEVVEGDKRVSLAATEVGLQLNSRLASLA